MPPNPHTRSSEMTQGPDQAAALGHFGLTQTAKMQELLNQVMQCPEASQELKGLCKQYHNVPVVPWKLLQQCCSAVRLERQPTSSDSTREASASTASSAAAAPSCNSPPTQQQQQQPPIAKPSTRLLPVPAICAGASIVLPTPPARQRSEQLQQRLAQLQDQADARQYASMVADITQDEQQAAAALSDPFFPTTKLQLSFGLHVIVTMGTFFALGFYGGRLLTRNDSWAGLSGAVGLMVGLLLETTLLIVRTNMPEPLEKKYGHLMGKQWDQGNSNSSSSKGRGRLDAGASQAVVAAAAAGTGVQPSSIPAGERQGKGSGPGSAQMAQQLRRRAAKPGA